MAHSSLQADRSANRLLPMHLGALTVELHLPGCHGLKQKRGRLKPLLAGLHRHFNVSAAEIDHQDNHHRAVIACVTVSNDARQVQRVLDGIPGWIESHSPDLQVIDQQMQLF